MATPSASRHRDLEQRFVDLEDQVRKLTTEALRSRQRSVTAGDFVVSGGGSVIVKDGGGFRADYANGSEAVRFGPATTSDGRATQALRVRDENQLTVFSAHRTPYDPSQPSYPDGQRVVQVGSSSKPVDLLSCMVGPGTFSMDQYGTVTLDGGSGGGVLIKHSTTASTANCVIGTTGLISRSTSSRRYKRDIAPAVVDVDAALALQPRAFRSKAEVAELGDDAPKHVGFIAEEAADLGLDAWVTTDEDGPESFSYASWCVAQQAIIQRQQQQIDQLTARLDALERATPVTPPLTRT